jgi:hypothetical protein
MMLKRGKARRSERQRRRDRWILAGENWRIGTRHCHCERSEAIQESPGALRSLDRHVASLLAMTGAFRRPIAPDDVPLMRTA